MITEHEHLRTLYDLWAAAGAAAGAGAGGRLPARAALPVERLRPWLGHLAILRVIGPERRLRIDLVGCRIVELDGVDGTGRFLDEIVPPHLAETMLAPYREVLARARPVYHRFSLPSRPQTSIHRLLLPLADDGARVDRILSGIYADPDLVKSGRKVFEMRPADGRPPAPFLPGGTYAKPKTSCLNK